MIEIHLAADGTGELQLPTGPRTITTASLSTARDEVITILTNHAQTNGRTLTARVDVAGDTPPTLLEVHPNGTINELPPHEESTMPTTPIPEPTPLQSPVPPRPADPPAEQPTATPEADHTGPDKFIAGDTPVARSFVKQPKDLPTQGFRGFLTKASGGLVNPGLSRRELLQRELRLRIAKPIVGTRNIVAMCLKGGISKTSTTCGVGLSLAEHRPDAVLAIDANPDAGDLADRLIGHDQVEATSPRTITDLVTALDAQQIDSLTSLNRYTQTSGRLHFIAGEQDPDVSESLTAEQYLAVRNTVDRFYPVTLTDCGTGVTHPAMKGILERADQLVVASGWAVTGAKRAQRTLTWLHEAHNGAYRELAENAIVVLTDTGATSKDVDRDAIIATLENLCRDVHIVPYDEEVGKGDLISLDALKPATRQAYLAVGASIADAL